MGGGQGVYGFQGMRGRASRVPTRESGPNASWDANPRPKMRNRALPESRDMAGAGGMRETPGKPAEMPGFGVPTYGAGYSRSELGQAPKSQLANPGRNRELGRRSASQDPEPGLPEKSGHGRTKSAQNDKKKESGAWLRATMGVDSERREEAGAAASFRMRWRAWRASASNDARRPPGRHASIAGAQQATVWRSLRLGSAARHGVEITAPRERRKPRCGGRSFDFGASPLRSGRQ